MSALPLVVGLLLSLAPVLAFGQQAEPNRQRTPAVQATNRIGQIATIRGNVAEVTNVATQLFLNFEKPYPDHPFSAVVFKNKFKEFPDVRSLTGKTVEVTGLVKEFKGRAQIVLTNKSQLVLIK
jgi:hypothetical protein